MRDTIERRLQRLEAQSARVHNENEMLKTLVLKSRRDQQRMQDKVAKVLIQIMNLFTNTNAQLPSALMKASVCCTSTILLMIYLPLNIYLW